MIVVRKTTDAADVATLRTGPFTLTPPFVIGKLGQSLYRNRSHLEIPSVSFRVRFYPTLTAQVWVENHPVELVIENARGLPVLAGMKRRGRSFRGCRWCRLPTQRTNFQRWVRLFSRRRNVKRIRRRREESSGHVEKTSRRYSVSLVDGSGGSR